MSWLFSKALMQDFENSRCSQEPGEAFSEENFLDGEPCAQLSGSHTQLAYLPPDKMTAFSRLSRFGMTFKPLTESRGEDLLMWYREDFLAKTYQWQEKAQELTASDQGCGSTWQESFAKYNHDSCSWKIRQHSLFEDLEQSLEIWPRWGLMLDGECYLAKNVARLIVESASGFMLPTIGKNEFRSTSASRYLGSKDFRGAKMCEGLRTCETDPTYIHPSFAEKTMDFPTMWTGLAPLGMHKFQSWQQQHSEFSADQIEEHTK
jgi:hypothetical protein